MAKMDAIQRLIQALQDVLGDSGDERDLPEAASTEDKPSKLGSIAIVSLSGSSKIPKAKSKKLMEMVDGN